MLWYPSFFSFKFLKMDKFTFNNHVIKRLDEIKTLLVSKGNEYANSADAHHNFKKATELSLHNKPEQVLWEYCVKHLQSIRDIVTGKSVDYSIVKEKTGDVIAYMLILESMYSPVQHDTITETPVTTTGFTYDQLIYVYWNEGVNK
jgi:hypothetical protein